jgi:uncharacterized phosphosugar-binding protein
MMTINLQPGFEFMDKAQGVLDRIRSTQMDAIGQAAEICTNSIANGGLVHLFGTGHSRIPIEEMFPRHGSFPGFHPIVELSLTFHTQVIGANGQRQAMFLERVEGLGQVILNNFIFHSHDSFMLFSNGGVNEVIIDVALGARERKLPVIAIASVEHCKASTPRHSSGKRLIDLADVVIDNCTPVGDAMVKVEGLDYPVGPGSTLAYAAIVNALKTLVAAELTKRGQPPLVLTSGALIGSKASSELFDRTYDDYRDRIAQVYSKKE